MNVRIPQPDRCIACATCVAVCPVAQNCPDFPGPRMMGPARQRFRLMGMGEDEASHYCANCKNCDIACPGDVPVSAFIMRAKAEICKKNFPKLRDWILAHGEVLAHCLRFIPAVFKNFGMTFAPARLLLDAIGIARKASLPNFAPQAFRARLARLAQPNLSRAVVFFPGCFVDTYEPESGLDIVAVLNRAGYKVIVPGTTDDSGAFVCCGLPMVANGFWQDARDNARRNLKTLAAWAAKGMPILTACPSCALMIGKDYAEYFPALIAPGQSSSLVDVCDFLIGCVERGELALPAAPQKVETVFYHAPCHSRALGIGLPGLDLLREIPGIQAEYADSGCCGISGSYGFKKDKYPIAMRVGAPLFEAMRQSGATLCASECGTCRVQMRHGGGKQTVHPVSVLRRYLG
ncbi:MAG: anaerobic glycerol-3-phosphate dehydrogenase subunit C [Candidatus Desulfovibrio kirbyi]|uniref:Anaerobic glycerol-3-phosphate dehydrogenase subunit C n=1 Tax=Candidatus Desulfovibrio kirbyi TaxID=2696086 RepID=A0A6L2R5B0_9BACT|nr:MAG: anaerobic glycerol-3-phosphate dehydrogenase subunit C [Candidatus Desulfovibrio kirbyi]